ncbi:zinc finger, C4 type [Ancylostoma caninum]|uniref:Zinc finger, C4 type n=1 Tax=Ancylostoma caninum TaxID=29170 RepID=A0A368FFM8_ANCCA|nr:zinc finger, C4 type [Ancylostoma caninum]
MLATPISMVLYHEISPHNKKREKIPEGTLCVVCADLASGIHYSVPSCNGCKTFFRRALVNKQTFTCQFSGDCVVGKSVRCVCRSCRLKKCFDMGMDPKG